MALFLPVILVSLIVVLAFLAAFVSVFALCLLPFCVATAPTYQRFCNQPPCFVLCRINRNKKHHWRRIHIQWIRLYLLSKLCHGLLLCHSKVIFVMQPIFSMHHWKPSTTSFSTLVLPCTKAPSTLFGSVRLCTPSLVDLERILEAILLSRTYSKLHNLLGIVPLFPMVMVYIPQPMSQI